MRAIKHVAALMLMGVISAASVFAAQAAQTEEKEAYSFTYEEETIELGEAASTALKKLGEAKSEQPLTNCADDSGHDMCYIYDGFEVITTKKDGKEIVNEITITKADIPTEEGLEIGDLPATVKKLYSGIKGELGLYTAELGDTKLIIDCDFDDSKVIAITYEYAAK